VPELGPLTITARNRDQAEYLVRSRAQQRGVSVQGIVVAPAGPGAWLVTIDVAEADAEMLAAAALEEDTQVLHFRSHPPRER
jgi:sarcosine oxidase gamma subunit